LAEAIPIKSSFTARTIDNESTPKEEEEEEEKVLSKPIINNNTPVDD